jgi:hypothetical protein
MRSRALSLAFALASASCVQVTLRDARPDVTYDARGSLAYCSGGALRVEDRSTGRFRQILGPEWDVREAEPLPEGGWVFVSGADAPVDRGHWGPDEETVEIWGPGPDGRIARLTNDVQLESHLVVLPDGSGIAFSSVPPRGPGPLTAATPTARHIEFASGSEAAGLPLRTDMILSCPVSAEAGGQRLWLQDRRAEGTTLVEMDWTTGTTAEVPDLPYWAVLDGRGRSAAWTDFETPTGRSARHFVRWLDRASATAIDIPCSEHVAVIAIAPDGERIAIVEHDGWVLPALVVLVRWRSATLREFDRAGGLLRKIDL